jgi:hypothetical protein
MKFFQGKEWIDIATIAKLMVKISADNAELIKGAQQAEKRLESFGKTAKRTGQILTGFLTVPIAGAGVALVKLAADAEETQSKFNVVFRGLEQTANEWAVNFADSVGRARTDIKDYTAILQDTFVPMGFARDQAFEFSKSLVALGIDVASFNNQADADVINNFTSAIMGNTMAVRSYGIMITEARIKQMAFNEGLDPKHLTEIQKQMLRYKIIIESTRDAQGDAVRTGQSFANQIKEAQAMVTNISESIGKELIPVLLPLLKNLNKTLKEFEKLNPEIKKFIIISATIAAALGPAIIALSMTINAVLTLWPAIVAAGAAVTGFLAIIGPIPLILGAVVLALVGAAKAWENNWFNIQEITKVTVARLVFIFKDMGRQTLIIFNRMKRDVLDLFFDLLNKAEEAAELLPGNTSKAFGNMKSAIRKEISDTNRNIFSLKNASMEASLDLQMNLRNIEASYSKTAESTKQATNSMNMDIQNITPPLVDYDEILNLVTDTMKDSYVPAAEEAGNATKKAVKDMELLKLGFEETREEIDATLLATAKWIASITELGDKSSEVAKLLASRDKERVKAGADILALQQQFEREGMTFAPEEIGIPVQGLTVPAPGATNNTNNTNQNNDITINVNGTKDPEETARIVKQELSTALRSVVLEGA